MPTQVRKQKQATKREYDEPQATPEVQSTDHAKTDALLDSIDEVLDEMLTDQTAQEFVDGFRQKGGQ